MKVFIFLCLISFSAFGSWSNLDGMSVPLDNESIIGESAVDGDSISSSGINKKFEAVLSELNSIKNTPAIITESMYGTFNWSNAGYILLSNPETFFNRVGSPIIQFDDSNGYTTFTTNRDNCTVIFNIQGVASDSSSAFDLMINGGGSQRGPERSDAGHFQSASFVFNLNSTDRFEIAPNDINTTNALIIGISVSCNSTISELSP